MSREELVVMLEQGTPIDIVTDDPGDMKIRSFVANLSGLAWTLCSIVSPEDNSPEGCKRIPWKDISD